MEGLSGGCPGMGREYGAGGVAISAENLTFTGLN